MKLLSVLLFVFISFSVVAQTKYTLYDGLPTINKSEKPSYSEKYPSWAKKLYHYPVNFNEISDEFDAYMSCNADKKNAIIRYYKNWKSAIEPYVQENGEIIIPGKEALFIKNKAALLQNNIRKKSAISNNSNWTFWGPKETIWRNTGDNAEKAGTPAPWQANVYSFDVSSSNPEILYCGTETGFVNKTNDNGLTWNICGQDYFFGGGVTATAIHPSNPEIVYVSAGKQIHKTVDGGQSWTPMLTTNSIFSASRLRIDSNNHNKIIAATDEGIFISTNGGDSWGNKWNKQTWDIEIKPDDSNIIYGISSSKGQNFELVISKDGGNTFVKDPDFPSNIKNKSGGLLAVTPANSNVIYVSMLVEELDDNYAYIYKGSLNNNTWSWLRTKRGEPREQAGLGGFSTGQGYFDFVLAVSPDNENTVFWGTCSLFKSIDGAVNFEKIGGYGGAFSIHPDIQDIKLLKNGKMWVSTDGGMNYSSDYFQELENWHPRIQGLIGSHMWGFDQGWNEDIIVGGRYHNGNTAITDFYEEKALRMGGAEAPTGWILHGRSRQAVFSDINKGYSTSIPATIDDVVSNKKFLFSKHPNMKSYGGRRGNLLHHPNYHSVLYVGEGSGFWKSSDMGVTFDLLHSFNDDVMFVEISHKNPKVLYADVEGDGLFRSENGGETWTHKPALISNHGRSDWAGKIHFVISPYDENTIYACPQKTSASWQGKILKSTDGGGSWENWSGSLPQTEYTKTLAIQPTKTGKDLVYIVISAQKNVAEAIGKVYFRKEGMNDWEAFDNNYPAGMSIIYAKPFYRDSKIRVAGKGGIWESPLAEPDFLPLLNPWIDVPVSTCTEDTLRLDDHSILNHEGASWNWEIHPQPQYISDATVRNPKIVPGEIGNYSVTLNVTQSGEVFSKTIENMFSVTSCPSVNDCSNPAELDKSKWTLIYADSQENDRLAIHAFDNDASTFWHTKWRSSKPVHPHEIQIDLGESYNIHQLGITNRSSSENGRIKDYKIYLSDNKANWGSPIRTGVFEKTVSPQPIKFDSQPTGRYLKIVALSEVNDKEFTTIAEINIIGCYTNITSVNIQSANQELKAFPVPTSGTVQLSIPERKKLDYRIYALSGQVVSSGIIENGTSFYSFDLSNFVPGVYVVILTDNLGTKYRAKIVKSE